MYHEIAVHYMRGDRYEGIRYAPGMLPDESLPEHADVDIRWSIIASRLNKIREAVEQLAECAVHARKCGPWRVESRVEKLTEAILPNGFSKFLGSDVNPVFLPDDQLAAIPWEMFEEHFAEGPQKLGISRFVSYAVRPRTPNLHPPGRGFLLIIDPTGDLLSERNDPERICRRSTEELCRFIEDRFDTVTLCEDATPDNVLEQIARPDLAGIYFLGHGDLARQGPEGQLLFRERPLFAREIKAVRPSARLVFLNACWTADAGGELHKYGSVAHAFAQGPDKTVIGCPWPVVNTQAAPAALTFFKEMLIEGKTCGEAMRVIREKSLARYNADEPDLTWMGYRVYGNPDRRLRPQEVAPQEVQPVRTECSLFDADDDLRFDVFSFGILDVMLRAAKRRNLQHRAHVTLEDVTAGLLRTGDLTRFVCRQAGSDPDILYQRLCNADVGPEDPELPDHDGEGSDASDDASVDVAALLRKWVVRNRSEFEPIVLDLLRKAHEQSSPNQVRERAVLENLFETRGSGATWLSRLTPHLPPAGAVYSSIAACVGKDVDENGCIVLDGIDDSARAVVQEAHHLAQQRGQSQIPNRLVLAAFLADSEGPTARALQEEKVPVDEFRLALIASTEGKAPSEFAMTHEACARIITPMLTRAREHAARRVTPFVDERILFRAFVEVMDSSLKFSLSRLESFPVNLDDLVGKVDPNAPVPAITVVALAAKFDENARAVIDDTARLAKAGSSSAMRTPHLFAAMIGAGARPVGQALRQMGMNPLIVRNAALALVPRGSAPSADPVGCSENVEAVLERAVRIASSEGRSQATEQDLFVAFFSDGGGVVGELLLSLGIELAALEAPAMHDSHRSRIRAGAAPDSASSLLLKLGSDLTDKARKNLLHEIVGRDNEIVQVLQTLLLTENANPLLVGDAGTGKTAIVEGIAQRIVSGRCPKPLQEARLIELSAGTLVANTRFRGDFEQRMQDIFTEAKSSNVILFIDEIHTIVGAGLAEGGGADASNMLKTALARGEIRLIGATTFAEYRRTIARDKALSRRFHVHMVNPPSRDATIAILDERQETLEKHHQVRITNEAKVAAVDLSGRYILNLQWPAKARDILERACVMAMMEGECETVTTPAVTSLHVAKVVAEATGLPVERVSVGEQSALATLEERISNRIIGQQRAVQTVAEAIRRGRQGLTAGTRPWGVFLFVGPPGVGKTELAKVLADEVYGGGEGLIRFDMGEFTEPHSTARLVGAPPGYIGFDRGAPLVEQLRSHPYSLLLFDEIEHAHEHVLAVLLRLCAEGAVKDAEGTIADARNSIIIMTSNILDRQTTRIAGFRPTSDSEPVDASQGEMRSTLERQLTRKLIDRIDAIVRFNPLTQTDLEHIAADRIAEVLERATALHGLAIEAAPEVVAWVARRASSQSSGARAIQRVVDVEVTTPLADFLTRGHSDGKVVISADTDAIRISTVSRSDSGADMRG